MNSRTGSPGWPCACTAASAPACSNRSTNDASATNSPRRSIAFQRQVALPVRYDDVLLDCGYIADIIVDGEVILELKSVERTLPLHEAQLLTYLRLSPCRVGLLINFNTVSLTDGIKRCVV